MLRRCVILMGLVSVMFPNFSFGADVYKDPKAPLEARVKDAISKMSFLEKLDLVGGTGFATRPVPSIGLPTIQMTDGPMGVRSGNATAFPSGLSMGATFNPDMARIESQAMSQEAKALGKDMLLGPCIDISRQPFGGRNFESFGEDPYLTSRIVEGYLAGVQSEHVLPSTKHYALNDQEYKRMTINVIADERTMQEIHLPAFHAAVNAGTWTIMASYNRLNGAYASENGNLLNKILKQDWGFKGFVVSDWGATHSTVAAAKNGLDLEMPMSLYFGIPLWVAVKTNSVSTGDIDDKVERILRAMFGSGMYDHYHDPRPPVSTVGGQPHLDVARRVAAESLVLLKNDEVNGHALLPMDGQSLKTLALIGPGAMYGRTGGGGSSMVSPTRVISPLRAFSERLPNTKISYATGATMKGDFVAIDTKFWKTAATGGQAGLTAEYFDNQELKGNPVVTRIDPTVDFDWGWAPPMPQLPQQHFSVRWTGYLKIDQADNYTFTVQSDDGVRMFINDKAVVDDWHNHALSVHTFNMALAAGQSYKVRVEYFNNSGSAVVGVGFTAKKSSDLQEAVALAKESQAVVIFAGLSANYESEGMDRKTLSLPDGQDELIKQVIKANPNTIVVINAGNPVLMPWIYDAKAVMYAWYAGQEGGYAIADTLLGSINPSGKLPVSFPKRWVDASAYGNYPEDAHTQDQVTYAEGIYVGYRHFDAKKIEPLFPFGFGLSYTNFRYSNLQVTTASVSAAKPNVQVSVDITNTGSMPGAEVAELYISENSPAVDRPPKELKGFQKISLQPNETRTVTFKTLDANSFAYWNVKTHGWTVHPGTFTIRVGGSSRDEDLVANTASVHLQ